MKKDLGVLQAVVGKIVNVAAEESVLDENGKVDPVKLNALCFDNFQNGYYELGTKAGQAWSNGKTSGSKTRSRTTG